MFPELMQDQRIDFPDPNQADGEGLLATGGNLSPGMLLSAYEQGIFPWFNENSPILWWSPDPRCILVPGKRHVSNTMKKVLRNSGYTLTFDTCFPVVIDKCAKIPRKDEQGTWITSEMKQAYVVLEQLGYAHSVEVWKDGQLAGGLYGISLGKLFFGESMFSTAPNGSKFALLYLAAFLEKQQFTAIDCQIYTDHLATLGAEKISRPDFLEKLKENRNEPGLYGSWSRFNDLPVYY